MGRYRLLVVEDDHDMAELIHCVAGALDFDAHILTDTAELATVHEVFQPHLILLDILMPDMDGFEVLTLLRQLNCQSHILVLSAQTNYLAMAQRMGEGLGLKVTNLAKPFPVNTLRETLETIRQEWLVSASGVAA